MTPMADTKKLVAEARALDEKATAGPWRAGVSWKDCVMVPHHTGLAGPGGERVLLRMNDNYPHEHDAALIARYRTLAPQLADEVERLAAEVAELRRERDMPCAHRLEEERIQVENARLRALLIEATPNGETCHNWRHNAESCRVTTLPRDKWCWHCRVCALLAETEVDDG